MRIAVIGTGYVGLVTGASLANGGHTVTCVDIDQSKVEKLSQGICTIWEPGLEELLKHNLSNQRLFFTTDLTQALQGVEAVFIAVGTPQAADGKADLTYLFKAAENIRDAASGPHLTIVKSTVPVGTGEQVSSILAQHPTLRLPVASNPEFLKEGSAVEDFKHGERIIIGVNSPEDEATLRRIYEPFNRKADKIISMDVKSAELTKYAANAMLATRISFMNEMANIAEATGANIDLVRKGIGSDPRIGNQFLYAGVGYGGSCFPKDVTALAHTAMTHGVTPRMLQATDEVNDLQKEILFKKLQKVASSATAPKVTVWGLAFKAMTDDVRESSALDLIEDLLEDGYTVTAYDPVATDNFIRAFGPRSEEVTFAPTLEASLADADILMICTDWEEFRTFNPDLLRHHMRGTTIIDGRNLYDPTTVRSQGFTYLSVGRP